MSNIVSYRVDYLSAYHSDLYAASGAIAETHWRVADGFRTYDVAMSYADSKAAEVGQVYRVVEVAEKTRAVIDPGSRKGD